MDPRFRVWVHFFLLWLNSQDLGPNFGPIISKGTIRPYCFRMDPRFRVCVHFLLSLTETRKTWLFCHGSLVHHLPLPYACLLPFIALAPWGELDGGCRGNTQRRWLFATRDGCWLFIIICFPFPPLHHVFHNHFIRVAFCLWFNAYPKAKPI